MIDVFLAQDDGTRITQDDGTPILLYSYQPAPPPVPAYTIGYFKAALMARLPRGLVWPRDQGAVLPKVMEGLAPTFARLTGRAAALLQDAPAGELNEMLPEWEATLGLPDPCAGAEPTIALRRQQVLARIGARGGQSAPYFVSLAAALGYSITVTEFSRSRFGRQRFGKIFGGPAWSHTWQTNVAGITRRPFAFGRNRFGEGFSSWGNAVLECELRRVAPAHTLLRFAYVGELQVQAWNTAGAGWA